MRFFKKVFREIGRVGRHVEQALRQPVKAVVKHVAVPLAVNTLGNALIPGGGILLNAFEGSMRRGGKHKLAGAVAGAARGIAVPEGARMLGNALGVDPSGLTGKILQMNQPGLFGGENSLFGENPLFGGDGDNKLLNFGKDFGKQLLGNFGQQMAGNLINGAQNKNQSYGQEDGEEGGQYGESQSGDFSNGFYGNGQRNLVDFHNPDNQQRLSSFAPSGMSFPGLAGSAPNISERESLHDIEKRKRAKKKSRRGSAFELDYIKPKSIASFLPSSFAEGGYASGPMSIGRVKHGYSGGQDDDIETFLPDKSYVWNATDVSLLGDGSTDNGIKKLSDFERNLLSGGIVRNQGLHAKGVRARVSNDEYIMSPEAVVAIGKGNPSRGVKSIDLARKELRSHKGVRSILPPKSRDIRSYMRG